MTRSLVARIMDEELAKLRATVGEGGYARERYPAARELFEAIALGDPFVEFLTLPPSERIDL